MDGRRCRRGMRAIVVLGLAACSGAPGPAPAAPTPVPAPRRPRGRLDMDEVAVSRPTVDVASLLPDFTEELRWPLAPSVHPDLEPAFPVAAQLADEGVTWHDLCAMGAQHRHVPGRKAQLVAYLGAWCSAAAHDDDQAVAQLASLGSTTFDGLGDALPIDLADILADAGDADDAEHLIAKYDLRDVAMLDDLAAIYVELGHLDGARAINQDALDVGTRSPEADQCHRAARAIVLGPSLARALKLQDLERVHVAGHKVPDPTCVALDAALACWVHPATSCRPYVQAQGLDPREAALIAAYYEWPDRPAPYDTWRGIARDATSAVGLPGAEELADAALAAAVETSACSYARYSDLDALEHRLVKGAADPAPVVRTAFQRFCAATVP